MLVLTRQLNERVVLSLPDGRRIDVTVTEVRSTGKVRLGFDAPADVRIDREEIHEERRRPSAA